MSHHWVAHHWSTKRSSELAEFRDPPPSQVRLDPPGAYIKVSPITLSEGGSGSKGRQHLPAEIYTVGQRRGQTPFIDRSKKSERYATKEWCLRLPPMSPQLLSKSSVHRPKRKSDANGQKVTTSSMKRLRALHSLKRSKWMGKWPVG